MTLGQKLSERRKANGYTQDAVAEKLGVSAQAVSKWENDISCPDITLLPQIAQLYGITIDELLTEKEPTVTLVKEGARKNIEDMVLRILVNDNRGDNVRINVPLSLAKALVDAGSGTSVKIGSSDLSGIDFNTIIDLVERGAIGRLMEVETGNGETVVIEVV